MYEHYAPGAPGIKAKWTSGDKDGIGKAIHGHSNVSFSISHGILDEIYYPREDVACVRDMQFLVTGENSFFSEEKRDTQHRTKYIKPGIPFYRVVNTCNKNKYQLKKQIICDPFRNTVLQKINFEPADNQQLKLFALISPHINNKGDDNSGWVSEYKGIKMLFAQSEGLCLALACSSTWNACSVGYVGSSDGWTELKNHHHLNEYTKADKGNIALTGEINLSEANEFLIAISFGRNPNEAASHARASLLEGFNTAKKCYVDGWNNWIKKLHNVQGKLFKESACVLRMHEAKAFPGGIIASLSIPWGEIKGDEDKGGYHVVWPRDLVESAGGFLALKSGDDVLRILNYLMSMQQNDGSWPQNMWLEGAPHWKGIQIDQIALPILLMDKCIEYKILTRDRMQRYWPIIKKAINYLILNGPYTQQDRWEEEKGFTPFTLATCIAALLAAADIAEQNDEKKLAKYCRETADYWNENIENWTYVTNTLLTKKYNIDGYYIRVNPCQDVAANNLGERTIHLQNHKQNEGNVLLRELICVDALALVRFGLRAFNDPKIINTIKIIDELLKVETPNGNCWHRYNNDGYGEDEQGNSYDKYGVGRAWPLLTGERAHYEVAAGNINEAKKLMKAIESFSGNGLLSEQIWDTYDIPDKELFFGRPSGSAMPLTWAHAEYLKLCASIKNKKVFDMPKQTQERYIKQKTKSSYQVWRFDHQPKSLSPDKNLRIEVPHKAEIVWTNDNWQSTNRNSAADIGVDIFFADIPYPSKKKNTIEFTFFWVESNNWEGKNYIVHVE